MYKKLNLKFGRRYRSSFYNLLGQAIQTSMQNLESVAQKMAELLQLVRKRTDILYTL